MLNVVYFVGRNARNFEDCGSSVVELEVFMFNPYVWMAAHNTLLFSNSSEFLDFCSSSP